MKHINNPLRLLSLSAILLVCLSAVAFGQEVTGSLVGTVKDANAAAVANATVTITDAEKRVVVRTVQTNDDGEFSVPNLSPGVYDVSVEAPSFKKHVESKVSLNVGDRRSVNVALETGNIAEVVTVEADPVAVDTTSATSGTIISGEQVRELSINNRNFTQLVTLAPGVSNDLSDQVYVGTTATANENNNTGAQANQPNTVNISVNGARSSQNTFTVDGADITDRGSNITIQAYPSIDSIGEFRVLRSLYPAESGRSGGGQVNVVTRSGGRSFHGSAFEFIRNEAFNANDFFSNQLAPVGRDAEGKAKRRPFRYNNYGWTFGGPMYFFNFGEGNGGIGKKLDKTFFFFSQEFRKDTRFPTLTSTVPDAQLKQGIFPVNICLQATGAACSLILPAGTPLSSMRPVNPLAQQYIDLIYSKLPPPTSPATYGLVAPALNKASFRQEVLKIDHSFSSDWMGYYRFQNDKIPTLDANAIFSSGSNMPGVSTTSTNSPGKTHTFQTTYTISPSTILEGRFTYGYGAILSNNVGTLALINSPIAPPLPYQNTRDRVPTMTANGFSPLQGFGPYDNFSWKKNWASSLTHIRGSHTVKIGGVYSMYRKNENALAGSNEGIYSAFNTPGGTANVLATGVTGTLNQNRQLWANFLQGTNATFTQASFDYTADLRQKAIEGYVQDEWRARKNLTLYIGVRYSYFGSPYDENGRLSNFVPELWTAADRPSVTGAGNRVAATGNNCNGMIVNAQNFTTGPAAFNCRPTASPWGKYVIDVPKTDFAPRVGLAWDPFGDGKTAVRTGYGIYHDQVLNGNFLSIIGLNQPYQQTVTISGTRIDQPLPPGSPLNVVAAATASNIRGVQSNWHTPYQQHWSLDVQRQVTAKTIMTVGYYGSKGVHLIGAYEYNELPPGFAISRGATGCAVGASTTPTAPCQVAGTAFGAAPATNILDQIRPYRGYRSINMITPQFNANYHSMQLSGQHRFTGSSQVNLAYTWAKNLTDNQTDRSTAPQNSYNIHDDYGRATLDRRHVLSINYIYELPFLRKRTDFVGKAFGGWQVSGIATWNTGLPLTATTSNFDAAGLGNNPALVSGNRPNVTCDPNSGGAQTQAQWFNTTCFTPNPLATATNVPNVVGNAGRGIINGPPTTRFDFTLTKAIRFGETTRLQLRGEAFNILNHTNFRAISTNVTAANFGQVLSVRDPRTLQFGAKFIF
ncbi:MAG: carboxypeptidase regulatory-like domain-containing protein [Pyrinomonadaceae bacterium]|nr:carboxypeptidase regulatory-like domain-containing protein [Pyrinomonadaceae bacterium]